MSKINELLETAKINLQKLGKQYKSGQYFLIVEALDALAEARHLTTNAADEDTNTMCTRCGCPFEDFACPRCGQPRR